MYVHHGAIRVVCTNICCSQGTCTCFAFNSLKNSNIQTSCLYSSMIE